MPSSTRPSRTQSPSHRVTSADPAKIRPFPSQIVEATFEGVGEAITNLTEAGAVDPLVKITLALDDDAFA